MLADISAQLHSRPSIFRTNAQPPKQGTMQPLVASGRHRSAQSEDCEEALSRELVLGSVLDALPRQTEQQDQVRERASCFRHIPAVSMRGAGLCRGRFGRERAHLLLLGGDAQEAAELEHVEEGRHHGKGPAEDDQAPDNIGAQHVGVVPLPPAPVPLAAVRSGACMRRSASRPIRTACGGAGPAGCHVGYGSSCQDVHRPPGPWPSAAEP